MKVFLAACSVVQPSGTTSNNNNNVNHHNNKPNNLLFKLVCRVVDEPVLLFYFKCNK